MTARKSPEGVTRWAPVLVALVFLVAVNLRPAITTVGPLLGQIGHDEGLSTSIQGLLGSLPLLAFAAMSPVVQHPSRRFGMEPVLLAALAVLVVGILVRSYGGSAGLWVGTVVLGCAIAVGNVLLPAIVKRDYRAHISRATGVYSACIVLGASLASGVAVPLANQGGWRAAMAFWALPAAVVALLWIARVRIPAAERIEPPASGEHPALSVWRQPVAWLVTAFMGLQSTTFYIMVTWLPTIEASQGISDKQAGLHLFAFQLVGIASGLAIPRLLRRPDNLVAGAVTASAPMVVGVLGLLVAPSLGVVWAVIAGLGSGAALVVALTLISIRGRTHHETTQLSGMAQSLGYLFAAAGPIVAGYLAQRTGSWQASLALLAALASVQVVVAVLAGRDSGQPAAAKPRPTGR